MKLIEYNARFGDPEAMNVLSILTTDLYSILEQMAAHKITKVPEFEKKATVCKYLVPEGYPIKSVTDQPLEIDAAALGKTGARLFYASVYEKHGAIYTQSSRSIGLVGVAGTIGEAEKISESACGAVSGKVWHRKDIGTPELLQRRVAHAKQLGLV